MSDFESYEVIDFAMDPRFQLWARQEGGNGLNVWQEWAAGRAEKLQMIEDARRLIQVMDAGQQPLSAQEIALEWKKLEDLLW